MVSINHLGHILKSVLQVSEFSNKKDGQFKIHCFQLICVEAERG